MTVTAGTDVRKFVKQVGADKVGVMAMPTYGDGVGAGKLGATSQTLGDHLVVAVQAAGRRLHHVSAHARELAAFYKDTGALPADDRFNASADHVPQVKQLFDMSKDGVPYLENFIPTDLDSKGNFGGRAADVRRQDDAARRRPRTMEIDMARIRHDRARPDQQLQDLGATE